MATLNNCVQLEGSLTIVDTQVTDLFVDGELHALAAPFSETHKYQVVEEARASAFGYATGIDYYIRADYDINWQCNYIDNHGVDGQDDQYSMNPFALKSADAEAEYLYFRASSGTNQIQVGVLQMQSADANLGVFNVTMSVEVNKDLMLTASVDITGDAISANLVEKPSHAQSAWWNVHTNTAPNVLPESADNLTQSVTRDEMKSHYSSELQALTAIYHGKNLLDNWTITLTGYDGTEDNPIAKYARASGRAGVVEQRDGKTVPKVFLEEELMVASLGQEVTVSIKDYTNVETVLSQTTKIYGVLRQNKNVTIPA